jgi:hypothetical protein
MTQGPFPSHAHAAQYWYERAKKAEAVSVEAAEVVALKRRGMFGPYGGQLADLEAAVAEARAVLDVASPANEKAVSGTAQAPQVSSPQPADARSVANEGDALDYIETNPDDHASRLLAALLAELARVQEAHEQTLKQAARRERAVRGEAIRHLTRARTSLVPGTPPSVQGTLGHISAALMVLAAAGTDEEGCAPAMSAERPDAVNAKDNPSATDDGGLSADPTDRRPHELRAAIEAVLMDANVTYGYVTDEGTGSPMMVERLAIVQALGYEDESAWLARTAEINAERRVASPATLPCGHPFDAAVTADEGTSYCGACAGSAGLPSEGDKA